MENHRLGFIISRVFALYFFFQTIWVGVPAIMATLFASSGSGVITVVITQGFSFIILAMASAIFWFKAETIGRMIAGSKTEIQLEKFTPDIVVSCIFVGFGVLFFSQAIHHLTWVLFPLFDERLNQFDVAAAMKALVFFGFAIWFIFGAQGLKNFVLKLRNFNTTTKN
jgi:hypothetical protein